VPADLVLALERGPVGPAQGRGPRRLAAGLERVPERPDAGVDAAHGGQGLLGPLPLARAQRRGELLEPAAQAAEHLVGGTADEQPRVGREDEQMDDERDAAPDERLDRPLEDEVARGRRRPDDDRRDTGLDDEQRRAAEQRGGGHGQHHHQSDLRGTGPDREDQEVGDEHADHDAAGQLQRALALLAERRAEADDRRDRRERALLAGQQQLGQVPRDHRGARRLQDGPPQPPEPAQPFAWALGGEAASHRGHGSSHAGGTDRTNPGGSTSPAGARPVRSVRGGVVAGSGTGRARR
jgi:hypothetical protein